MSEHFDKYDNTNHYKVHINMAFVQAKNIIQDLNMNEDSNNDFLNVLWQTIL